jgi:hypothetical protein
LILAENKNEMDGTDQKDQIDQRGQCKAD